MSRRLLAFALAAATALGANAASSRADEPVGPRLTPKLRDTLRGEMGHVLGASQDILAALVAGDHATVAERANFAPVSAVCSGKWRACRGIAARLTRSGKSQLSRG